MNKQRLHDILNQRNIQEIYYNEQPVWVQEINDNIAKIGFLNTQEEKDVYIEDLYEKSLYHDGKPMKQ